MPLSHMFRLLRNEWLEAGNTICLTIDLMYASEIIDEGYRNDMKNVLYENKPTADNSYKRYFANKYWREEEGIMGWWSFNVDFEPGARPGC